MISARYLDRRRWCHQSCNIYYVEHPKPMMIRIPAMVDQRQTQMRPSGHPDLLNALNEVGLTLSDLQPVQKMSLNSSRSD